MSKKLTKKQKFEMLAKLSEVKANSVLAEFIEHEIELLEKKSASDKKPTAQQKANMAVCEAILEGMAEGRGYTITELLKEIPACADLTNQRMSALMRNLIEDNLVERYEEKRKAYFRKV